MKGLNLNKFVKVSSDDNVTTLRHEAGHELKISHKNLSPEHRQQLEKLPTHAAKSKKPVQMFAEKGEVEPNPSDSQDSSDSSSPAKGVTINIGTPQQSTAESVGQKVGELGRDAVMNSIPGLGVRAAAAAAPYIQQGLKGFDAGFTGQPADASAPDAAPSPAQAAPTAQPGLASPAAPAADQGVTPPKFQDLPNISPGSVYDASNAANAMQLKADRAKASADLLAAQNHEAALRAAQTTYQDGVAQKVQDIDGAIEDFKSGAINPNHFMESKGTVGKVATAIGLILGGAGGGLTHQENPALKFLNSQIDRDIDSQKADLNKRHTLIGAYQKQYDNFNAAESMARATELGLYASKLEEAAAKAADPAAQARALQAKQALMSQMLPLVQQAQMFHMATGQGTGGKPQGDPAGYVPYIVPKEHQEAVYKEIERAQDTRRMAKTIDEAFERAVKDNTTIKRVGGLRGDPGSVLAFKQALQPTFKDIEGTVRQAAMDNTFENLTPARGDTDKRVDEKRKAKDAYVLAKSAAPRAKSFGLDLDNFGTTTTRQPQASSTQQAQNVREGATGTYQGKPVIFTGGKWQLKK